MAKVKFYLDSGANIHSCRSEEFDTVDDLGLDEGEWEEYTDDEKHECVMDWANNYLGVGWEAI